MKRKPGVKGRPIIDSIDFEILNLLKDKSHFVLEICKKINIMHKNLQPHLIKLLRFELIKVSKGINQRYEFELGDNSILEMKVGALRMLSKIISNSKKNSRKKIIKHFIK